MLVILPDGSRTLIPAAWTDCNDGQEAKLKSSTGAEADVVETLCTISDLLKARAVTDALLSRLIESAPKQEGDDAIGVGVSRTARGAGQRINGPLEPDRAASSDRRPRAAFAADCTKAGVKGRAGERR